MDHPLTRRLSPESEQERIMVREVSDVRCHFQYQTL